MQTVSSHLALPWLRLEFPDVDAQAWPWLEHAAAKFARGQTDTPLALTASVRVSHHPRAVAPPREPNAEFQFVRGVEDASGASYVTDDGSSAAVDHATGALTLDLRPAVFEAPYSTWADLFAAPLSAHWRACGYFPLHAAAVSIGPATVVIVGESGAGKTTMALALVDAGGRWRADDKLLVHAGTQAVTAVSLYRNTNLPPRTIAHHASLAFALAKPPINETNDKRPCALDEVASAVDLTPFVPTAVLFPRQVKAPTSVLRPISQVACLMRLAEQSPTYGWRPRIRLQQQVLAALAAQAPAFEVDSGTDVLEARDTFARLVLDAIGGAAELA